MKNRKLFYIGILLVFGLLVTTPILSAKGATYSCPSTQPGDTKILKVTTVDSTGLEEMFGSDWKQTLNSSFGGEASELGSKSKSVVTGIDSDAQHNTTFYNPYFGIYQGIGIVEACNITTNNWPFTTDPFNSTPDTQDDAVYSIKDPEKLNEFCYSVYAANVTIARVAIYFAQLPSNPTGYLAEINWSQAQGFKAEGSKVIHDITADPTWTNAAQTTYEANGTETWTYASNGAWIGYKLQDDSGKTIYEFKYQTPGAPEIPGYSIPITIGLTATTLMGIILLYKRKR